MGIDVLLEAVLEGEYDPACARVETALRAIWMLYRRDKWVLLEEMGIPKAEFQMEFQEFGDQYDIGRYLRGDRQTLEFLTYFRRLDIRLAVRLLSAAVWMIGSYMTQRRRIRASYYGWPEERIDA